MTHGVFFRRHLALQSAVLHLSLLLVVVLAFFAPTVTQAQGPLPSRGPQLNTAVQQPHLLYLPVVRTTPASATTPSSQSGPELVNPMRGLTKWRGNEIVPQPEAAKDAYQRYTWSQLETSQGVYNFSKLEYDIAQAWSQGRKFAFRVRDMVEPGAGIKVPMYLEPYGFYTTDNMFVPDYNHPFYQQRRLALLTALGAKYNADPRVAYLDIGMYGKWGEWHVYGVDYNSSAAQAKGIVPASQASKRAIVDAHVVAFPQTQLLMMTDDGYALRYAMLDVQTTIPIGWRRDSLARTHFSDGLNRKFQQHPDLQNVLLNRWKVAPVVAEFYGGTLMDFALAMQQVKDYHVTQIGNGNLSTWSSYSSSDQALLIDLGKAAGYRFRVDQVTLPRTLAAGSTLSVSSQWHNDGIAPAYEGWQVRYQLRSASDGRVVWQGASSVNLKTLLPTAGTPMALSDTLSLPSTLAGGTYNLVLVTASEGGRQAPLQLAIDGKQADGSYLVGTVTVTTNTLP